MSSQSRACNRRARSREGRARKGLDRQEVDRGEVADEIVDSRVDGRAVQQGDVESEARVPAPKSDHFGVGRQYAAGCGHAEIAGPCRSDAYSRAGKAVPQRRNRAGAVAPRPEVGRSGAGGRLSRRFSQ